MRRTRTWVLGLIVALAVVGTAIDARGPFGEPRTITYEQVFADLRARNVVELIQWRDQVKVVRSDGSASVMTVPSDRDFQRELFEMQSAIGVPVVPHHWLPEAWLIMATPWVPFVLLIFGGLVWAPSLARRRRQSLEPGSVR